MSILENLVDAFLAMARGASARAMFYLQTGVLEGDANRRMQAVLDRWVRQVERANLRVAILRALEGPTKAGPKSNREPPDGHPRPQARP